jgi:hypothetical protein
MTENQRNLDNKMFKSAKFIFDGNIVPNVHLKIININKSNGFCGDYILSLATTVNHYYNIEFIPYELKKD